MRRGPSARVGWFVAASMCWAPGCSRQPDTVEDPVLLIGVDGLEWNVMLPMLRDGELPNFASLMQTGAFGLLETIEPTRSPIIWTTIATGKSLEYHGILDFSRIGPSGMPELYTNTDRQTKALWNIASDLNRTVAVIGWWMTWPVEPVNGLMVSQTNTLGEKNIWKGALFEDRPGQVHPPHRQGAIMEILRRTDQELPILEREVFGEFRYPLTRQLENRWRKTAWAFRADTTYARIARQALTERPYDLTMIYLGGCDAFSHRFWYYMDPSFYSVQEPGRDVENFREVIRDYYRYTDRLIGEFVEAAGPRANLLIVSDHGMVPIDTGGRVWYAGHTDAPPGVIICSGPAIRSQGLTSRSLERLVRSELVTLGSVFDVAPTVLSLMRLPRGEDMRGRPIRNLFTEDFLAREQPPPVATHDTDDFLANRPRIEGFITDDSERLRQLADLGYMGDLEPETDDQAEDDESHEYAPLDVKAQSGQAQPGPGRRQRRDPPQP